MLDEYKRKRDFDKTPEPTGKRNSAGEDLKFVVQKHSARRLHYDLRLEIDGVLVSFAIPKGPSYNPADKRLAVHTEDHPIDYDLFEGVIPPGEYGAGQMIIWDHGIYSPDEKGQLSWQNKRAGNKRMREGLAKGKLSFVLRGEKLQGSWTLFRLSKTEKDWILLKHRDEFADPDKDVTAEDWSVVSGRTIEDLKEKRSASHVAASPDQIPGVRRGALPKTFEPMTATLTDGPFSSADWIYEPKLDGIRAIASVQDGEVTLQSRRGFDLTASYPDIVRDLQTLKHDVLLDGEIVAIDERGRPSFQHLQQRSGLTRGADVRNAARNQPVLYYIFDIVHLDGYKLENVPLTARKELLMQTVKPGGTIKRVEPLDADGMLAYQACLELGLEGIVAKRSDSRYEIGKRSRTWLKVKPTMSSEFVVCGYTTGTGGRGKTFGSLLLGYYDRDNRLHYAGGCGTGFNTRSLTELYDLMQPLKTSKSPFKEKIPGAARVQFLEPRLVAEVKFAEWTRDNKTRAPVFVRLREDKRPQECTREHITEEAGGIKLEEPVVHRPENKTIASVTDLQSRRRQKESSESGLVNAVIAQLENDNDKLILDVGGDQISFTSLNKEFWPATGEHPALTKRDYALYLARVSPWLLLHMKDRPLTFLRFPNGIKGGKFYQKHWAKGLPDFVERVSIFVEHAKSAQEYIVVNNLPTLLWLAQIADLELHTWQSRISGVPEARQYHTDFASSLEALQSSVLNYPDYLLFDLDPYTYSGKEAKGDEPELNRRGFKQCVSLAKWLKEIFDALGIEAFIKTTGRTGLHIYVPIMRDFNFDQVRALSDTIGRTVMSQHREDVTMEWAVIKRTGKTFLDHNMNARGKTLASIYSPRISPEAAVSVPVPWNSLDDIYPTDFTMRTVPELLRKNGDLWADILEHKNDLKRLLDKRETPGSAQTQRRRKTS